MTFRGLVLFDIDGTLVRRAGPHHREALVQGIRSVTGFDSTTEGIPVQGMLDPDIIRIMLRKAGAPPQVARAQMARIQRAAEDYYLRVCPALHDKHCPGVEQLLARLAGERLLLALVTGNLTRIGWRKLNRAGLDGYFHYGAFGEMAKTRAGLAKLAIRTALVQSWIARDAPISLIGDAPPDIQAARENGIRSVAVKTGITPPEELERLKPDVLLDDLRKVTTGLLTGR
ncbi:MAG TPA: HAD hydrolase-like protein [Candidatus Limnocylindrales bacterium]|nr:HAD hydrolase-like protein [Candidatus Limnocylindrales bacterium]